VSTFGDVEDPWDVHFGKFLIGLNRFGHGLKPGAQRLARSRALLALAVPQLFLACLTLWGYFSQLDLLSHAFRYFQGPRGGRWAPEGDAGPPRGTLGPRGGRAPEGDAGHFVDFLSGPRGGRWSLR
jgi:hypothetical protein